MTNIMNVLIKASTVSCILFLGILSVSAQKECRATGFNQVEFTIKNELKFDIEIRHLRSDCSENDGLTVGANREIKVSAFGGQSYRIYENWTDRVLTEVKFREDQLIYSVSGFEASQKDPSKKLCSRVGDPRPMSIRNATGKPIVIKYVTKECVEKTGPVINPGKQVGANTFVNNVFRAYDAGTGKFLSQFVIRPTERNYVIGGEKDENPGRSFLKTVNSIRAHSGIPPLQLNETLNTACRWFAEFMSEQDKDRAGHLVTDFTNDPSLRNMNTPAKRLKHFGWKGSDSAETTALVRVEDPELIGAYFVMEWSSSTTHFMPFYDLYKTKFRNVGFAAVPSKRDPDLYYGCAIFGNE